MLFYGLIVEGMLVLLFNFRLIYKKINDFWEIFWSFLRKELFKMYSVMLLYDKRSEIWIYDLEC